MRFDANRWIDAAWIAVGVIWLIGSFVSKPTVRRQSEVSRFLHSVTLGFSFYLLFNPQMGVGPLGRRFVPATVALPWIGLALTIAGIAFAVWARFALGGNWSGTVTIKEDHQLIRTGPYAIVRHPIYTGLLLAEFGTALAFGEVRGLVAVAIATVSLRLKSLAEESFMAEQFGDQYAQYRRETKALVPFVW
jgi:protein-S-isoprenylcysteine O-methyltransferase